MPDNKNKKFSFSVFSMLGKSILIFLEISKNATKYSFSRGYSRRMVRSSSYYNYIDFLFDLFTDLVDLNFLNLD